MFSLRFEWDRPENRLSTLRREKQATGTAILDLTESNPTQAGLAYEEVAILRALGKPEALRYEPSPAGLLAARKSVAAYYAARPRTVDPDDIVLTASTSEAYSFLFKILTDPGDEVLAPRPSYPLFDFLAAMDAVRLRYYPLRYDHGWWIDLAALKEQITKRTRAILAVSPNNPTGSCLKPQEAEGLIRICESHGLALIIDEVFADYRFNDDSTSVNSYGALGNSVVFLLNGLSKTAGLPQMKLGWIVVQGREKIRKSALRRLETVADTYLSVSTPIQHAAADWLARRGVFQARLNERLRENLALLRGMVAGSQCELLKAEGGWSAVLRLPRTRSEEEWVTGFLDQDDVLVQPGYFFDFESEAYVVVSLMTPPVVFEDGIRRMLARISAGGDDVGR